MLKLLAQLKTWVEAEYLFVQTVAEEVLNISVSMYSKLSAVKAKFRL